VDVAGHIGGHQAGHAEQGIGPEHERIEEGVVDPAIDDVDPDRAVDRLHPDLVVVHDQVGPLDQVDPHIVGEEAVLIEGRIVVAGGEQHAARLARAAPRRDRIERLAQQLGIGIDRPHREDVEQFRAEPKHRVTILDHVGDAGGRARIVLEHEEFVRPGADQVDPANMGIDSVRRTRSGAGDAILGIGEDDIGRNHAVGQDLPRAIDVVDEGVDRPHPLLEPGREPRPFRRGEDPRDDIERDDPFGRFLLAIDREGDAEAAKGGFGGVLAPFELGLRRVAQPVGERSKPGRAVLARLLPQSSSNGLPSAIAPRSPVAARCRGANNARKREKRQTGFCGAASGS